MTRQIFKYGAILGAVVSIAIGLLCFYPSGEDMQNFNVSEFRDTGYTDEELQLFSDIAFNRKEQRIRKWNTDIKVEIKERYVLNPIAINEVDSVITILASLIAPHKIYRVYDNGNVHVYRNVRKVKLKNYSSVQPVALKGLTQKNRGSEADWDITSAVVYVRQGASTQTLLHEFLHVLGLEHPEFRPPYYVNIGRSVFSNYLYPEKERIYFEQRFYMSPQEKTAIRMLYSPEIKSGLKKEVFEASVSGLVK